MAVRSREGCVAAAVLVWLLHTCPQGNAFLQFVAPAPLCFVGAPRWDALLGRQQSSEVRLKPSNPQ
eukprot:2064180-Prorocentrum_lima.AAC.1